MHEVFKKYINTLKQAMDHGRTMQNEHSDAEANGPELGPSRAQPTE